MLYCGLTCHIKSFNESHCACAPQDLDVYFEQADADILDVYVVERCNGPAPFVDLDVSLACAGADAHFCQPNLDVYLGEPAASMPSRMTTVPPHLRLHQMVDERIAECNVDLLAASVNAPPRGTHAETLLLQRVERDLCPESPMSLAYIRLADDHWVAFGQLVL